MTGAVDTRVNGYRSVLALPAFRLLWLGETAGRFGFQLTNFLLPLIAVTALNASGTQVGLISTAQFLPVVLFALVAGAMVGRAPLRVLLVSCNAVRAGALGLLGAVHAAGGLNLAAMLVVAVLVGTATVFYDVGFQASIPHVLAVGQIAPANGLLQAMYSVSQLAGPALAGALLQTLGVGTALVTALTLFLGALTSFALLRTARNDPSKAESLLRSIGRGARYVWRCRPIRDLCMQAGVFNLFEQAFLTAFMVFAVRELSLSAGVVGLVIGIGSLGALGGALIAPTVRFVRVGVLVCSALPLAAFTFLLVPLLVWMFPGAVVPLVVAFLLNGVALSFFNVFAVSLRQSIPPPDLLGASTATYRLMSFGPIPLGALLGGVAIDLLGGSAALWLIGGMATVLCLAFVGSPLRSLTDVTRAREFASRWTTTEPHDGGTR
ncbi:MAG: MFS transporter [Actinomycetota bacterium]|nr:MFS transporter [Actinomycetota bacterium]